MPGHTARRAGSASVRGSMRRGSPVSSPSPSALARRLAGSMLTTATLRPRAARPSASAAETVVLPTPPAPTHTHTRFSARRFSKGT